MKPVNGSNVAAYVRPIRLPNPFQKQQEGQPEVRTTDFTYFARPDKAGLELVSDSGDYSGSVSPKTSQASVMQAVGRRCCFDSYTGMIELIFDQSSKSRASSDTSEAPQGVASAPRGRGLACACARGKYASITVRDAELKESRLCTVKEWVGMHLGDGTENLAQVVENSIQRKFIPESGTSDRYPISISAICQSIFQVIFEGHFAKPEGVLAISGSTASGKSKIARGLISMLLENRRFLDFYKHRLPHLLTIEDPIEKPYAAFDFRGTANLPKLGFIEEQIDDESFMDPSLIQLKFGIDYTPRELGIDSPSLTSALNDALRQTPAVVYIGEARDETSLREAIRFAGTGHFVILTMHAGGLVESLDKLLGAAGAQTPAQRGQVAQRLLGVVNLWKAPLEGREVEVTIPTIWKSTDRTCAGLVSDGLASIVSDAQVGCKGRADVLRNLSEEGRKPENDRAFTPRAAWDELYPKLMRLAVRADLLEGL